MELELCGRTALVSGASGSIGRAIARALAEEGARVLVGWHTAKDQAAGVVRAIEGTGGTARALHLDQSHPDKLATGLSASRVPFGPVDIVVTAAVRWPT